MAYVELTDLHGLIAPQYLTEALDDNQDAVVDMGLWEKIAAQVGESIDGLLGQRLPVPFTYPYPPLVTTAARVFAVEMLYARRGQAEKCPVKDEAERLRKKLAAIGSGDEALTPDLQSKVAPAVIISEDAKTTSKKGRLSV
jgi:hypothetical protein